MVEGGSSGSAPSTVASCRRGAVVGPAARRCCGGCGLGRLVRRLRRQGKQVLCAPRPAAAALRGCQYDPLSYARNFDQSGCGVGDADAAASIYYSYTFSSRFVLAASHPAPSTVVAAAAAAPTGIVTSRPTAASH